MWLLHDPQQLHTSVRAEMAAVHVAVDAATIGNRDVTIFTDCSTLIWNLIGMLHTPQRYAGAQTRCHPNPNCRHAQILNNSFI